ncbi:hypothetical protein F6V30_14660 [Oryzomonas sagensis]|uniref:Uncharacterized protein n=1 Tax=Oryzomonas sagensis TaxID=2603857 RepID=A0ABQ6TLC4_9BACT|nr:hypothetical protein [Oryzomonas sagensis]KAB0669069.1 hypothetical protein F6V30_14660 [Oryzomonas sagensis]
MTCEIFKCCKFFNDVIPEMPKSADYIKNKYCLGDNSSCARYRAYKDNSGCVNAAAVPFFFLADDAREIERCMKSEHLPDGTTILRSLLNDYLNDDK